MTQKDFQLIAATIYDLNLVPASPLTVGKQREMIATEFANALETTNPRFKRDLFIQAATGVVPVTARKAKRDCPCKSLATGFHNANCANRELGIGNPQGLPSGPVCAPER